MTRLPGKRAAHFGDIMGQSNQALKIPLASSDILAGLKFYHQTIINLFKLFQIEKVSSFIGCKGIFTVGSKKTSRADLVNEARV